MSTESPERRPSSSRGTVVEFVRLILVAMFTAGGWSLGEGVNATGGKLVAFIVLGSAVGFVIGGVIGRRTVHAVSAVERDFHKVPAAELLAAAIGLILGLLISVLASVLLFRLPPAAAYPSAAFLTVILTYLGYRLGRSKRDELFGIFGLKARSAGTSSSDVHVLDTSALIDGRVLDVVKAGFLSGTLLVLRGVLDELHRIADASDPQRRTRGQRGLQILIELQRSPAVDVLLIEEEMAGDVDAQLVLLARDRGASLVTTDANLAKVALALNVQVRSMNELAEAVRPPLTVGEQVMVHLSKEGREHGQGVGYLEDGTMIVVEGGKELLGSEVPVTVTNVLQTPTGRMLFARLRET